MSLLDVLNGVNRGAEVWKNDKKILTPLYLPAPGGALKMYGLIQEKVAQLIKWENHGFALVSAKIPNCDDDGFDVGHKRVRPRIDLPSGDDETIGNLISERFQGIYEELAGDEKARKMFKGLGPAKGNPEYAWVVAGNPHIRIPNLLAVHLGIVTAGIHLTVYTKDKETNKVDRIWVQRRAAKASYGGMLDQTVGGGVTWKHTFDDTLHKEAGEEMGTAEILSELRTEKLKKHGFATFYDLRIDRAGKLADLLEPGIRACYSLEDDKGRNLERGKDPDVKDFKLFTVDEVLSALEDKQFKPNCGLVMLKFLVDLEVIPKDGPEYEKIKQGVQFELPFPTEPLDGLDP